MNTINDDRVLDARDVAAEQAAARGETCAVHEGARLPCPFDHDAEVLADVDAVVEQLARPRTVLDVLAEWQDACEAEHKALPLNLEVLACASPLLLRLSALGNTLIHQAGDAGMRDVMRQTRERLKGE